MPLSARGANSTALDAMVPRRVEAGGGYVYDQYADGTIVIVSHNGVDQGTTCNAGTPANTAITGEIGEYVAPPPSAASAASTENRSADVAPPTTEPTGDVGSGGGIFGAFLELGDQALDGVGELMEGANELFQDTVADASDSFYQAVWGDEGRAAKRMGNKASNTNRDFDKPAGGLAERWIVSCDDTRIRTAPPELSYTGELIPEGAEVRILESAEQEGVPYSNVSGVDPATGQDRAWGWTSHSNLSDAAAADRAEIFASVEGGGGNKTQRRTSLEGGNGDTSRDVRLAFNDLEGQEYLDAADETVRAKTFTEDQKALIESAREFAQSPKPLTGSAVGNASISWSKLSMEGTSVNADLVSRMERLQQFAAWAGLVTGPTSRATGMRSPETAHKLSTAWMFNEGNTTSRSGLHSESNRAKLVDNLVNYGGTDLTGIEWVSAANVARVEAAQGDDEAIQVLLPDLRADSAKVHTQTKVAAEGFQDAESRRPNISSGSSVSNHLKGLAVDVYPQWIFPNKFDPVIDSIALYFGVYRSCLDVQTPEHWHFELLGTPPGPKEGEEAVI